MNNSVIADYVAAGQRRNLRPRTLEAQECYLQRTSKTIGKPLLEASRADLLEWQRTLAGYAVKSQLAYLSHVRSFYKWAVAQELLDRDPSASLIGSRWSWLATAGCAPARSRGSAPTPGYVN